MRAENVIAGMLVVAPPVNRVDPSGGSPNRMYPCCGRAADNVMAGMLGSQACESDDPCCAARHVSHVDLLAAPIG